MKKIIQLLFVGFFSVLILNFYSCQKDSLSKFDTAIVNMKIFDDDSIALPVTVAAGNNCLLIAYSNSEGDLKFNLTDNEGNLIWQKEFGINSINSILKENDGTFTIVSGIRFLNIDLNGNVLRDLLFDGLFSNTTIFNVQLTKNNNYLVYGVYGTGNIAVNRAFAGWYTHNGDSLHFRRYLDTITAVNIIGNYSVITGCEETEDGGYIFFGSYYEIVNNQISFNIIKTNNTGEVIWQKNNLLIDSQFVRKAQYAHPFTEQFPYSTDIYGFHPQSYTHEFMQTVDGNYLCFLNIPDYSGNDQRARVYKIDPDGNIIDSTLIDFGRYNRFMGGPTNYIRYSPAHISYSCGSGVVRNADNTFSICMQNGFFGSKGLTTSYVGESKSFTVQIDHDLNILNSHYLQNYYTDCFTSTCKSSDGRTVYFGLISSFGKSYKPALIFRND